MFIKYTKKLKRLLKMRQIFEKSWNNNNLEIIN